MKTYICKQCKKKFENKQERKFCSIKCYGLSQRERHEWKCLFCGKIFVKNPSRIPNKKKVFCSTTCAGKYKTRPDVNLICETCGKNFTVHIGQYERFKTRFCSSLCFGKSKRTKKYKANVQKIHSWRQSVGWNSFATSMLKAYPICEVCKNESQVIHHKIDPNPDQNTHLLFEFSNLQFLCRSCHGKIHQQLIRLTLYQNQVD